MNSFGDRRIKYSSASALAEYTIPHTIDISHGADSQCVAIPTDVQCKDYQGGSLVSSTNSPSSISNVTVDALKNATDLSIGSNFRCALANNDSANYWGSSVKGRLGSGGNTTYTILNTVNTTNILSSIESGTRHSYTLTLAGATVCRCDNALAQTAGPPQDNGTGTKSYNKLNDIAELTMADVTSFSKVSIGAEWFFNTTLIDNSTIAVWQEYNNTQHETHFVLNTGVAKDVAAGTDHICYLEVVL